METERSGVISAVAASTHRRDVTKTRASLRARKTARCGEATGTRRPKRPQPVGSAYATGAYFALLWHCSAQIVWHNTHRAMRAGPNFAPWRRAGNSTAYRQHKQRKRADSAAAQEKPTRIALARLFCRCWSFLLNPLSRHDCQRCDKILKAFQATILDANQRQYIFTEYRLIIIYFS